MSIHRYDIFEHFSERENEEEMDSYTQKKSSFCQPIIADIPIECLSSRKSKFDEDESKEEIKVSWRVYVKFFTYTKWTILALVVVFLSEYAKKQSNMVFDYYIIKWVKLVSESFKNDTGLLTKVIVYKLLSAFTTVIHPLFETIFTLTISVKLFRDMLECLMYAPVNRYFDVTPSGTILNRFSNDIQTVEAKLTDLMLKQINHLVLIFMTIILAAYNTIWILLLIPFLILALLYCFLLYTKSLKEAKRIEAITYSPILTNLNETCSGASTIRVFNKIDDFEQKQHTLLNNNSICSFILQAIECWFY